VIAVTALVFQNLRVVDGNAITSARRAAEGFRRNPFDPPPQEVSISRA